MKKFTRTVEGYTFEELAADVQAKVVTQAQVSHEPYEGWDQDVIDNFVADLEEIGIGNAQVQYTGFWSQGDGASFTSKEVDLVKLFEHMRSTNYYDVPESWMKAAQDGEIIGFIERIHRSHSHERTVTFDIDYAYEHSLSDADERGLHFLLSNWLLDQCKAIYHMLEKEYYALSSTDAIREELIQLDAYYTVDGNRLIIEEFTEVKQ
jgi:hypothetical protein